MKKKLFCLTLAAMLIASLSVGCGSDTTSTSASSKEETSDGKLIGVCMQNMSSSISELEAAALTEKFGAQGYEVSVQDAGDDVSKQVTQVQNFILQGAEMIVVLPCEIETLEDSLIEAREAGIKVVISGGTGTISDEAFDAVSADDEYVIGMWVASITKTWVEEYMDPEGDWTAWFCNSTISEDAKSRCAGEFQIVEPYLKNEAGEYVNEMWEVVDESEKIENPVYCESVAERVSAAGGLDAVCMESDISGDNRTVIANILTSDEKARVFIGYNSLISTAGSTYVEDTYADIADEFGFFSAGVMGDEYEYLVGAVSDTDGTKSVFRGACQFGGGDAAATLANLADAVLNGEEGVDYGKSNPNSIGLYYPVAGDLNDGVAELVFFDSPKAMTCYSYADIVSMDANIYWDSVNGYNENAADSEAEPAMDDPENMDADNTAGGALNTYGTGYIYVYAGIAGDETAEIDINEDEGLVYFYLPGSEMITDVYSSAYTLEGDTLTVEGFTCIDPNSSYPIPGLWDFIDGTTGAATFTIDSAAGTFAPAN